jgi:hypothetical protein
LLDWAFKKILYGMFGPGEDKEGGEQLFDNDGE